MSDTHSLTSHIKFDIPDGDIFIHAGDFTKCGRLEEVVEFNEWLGKLWVYSYNQFTKYSEQFNVHFFHVIIIYCV